MGWFYGILRQKARILNSQTQLVPKYFCTGSNGLEPIRKILIANRGEIACRIIRTAKRLGLKTVAVFSEADRHALHVRIADEAVWVGPATAQQSYLNGAAIIDAVSRTKADAIHPGYGFLSENAKFAELCSEKGIKFIGPSATAISLMGDKSASKKLMTAAGVPVVPGYHGDEQSTELLKLEANRIGYPVLIKPALGGGGKGMRIVQTENEFVDLLASSIRESSAAFADKRVLIEKYITQPRHIEVQIFGDKHGNVVHLFERDCSVQRRHQKIIEEAPAPHISAKFRQQIGQAAVAAAKAVGYENAGTVEFIVDTQSGEFYFMEMNTRLQVEHPVTEMVTNCDLVEWQIQVANGETLPAQQEEIALHGHAFETRIYAENVQRGFLPSAGSLHHYMPPLPSPTVRIETGVEVGDKVTVYYDPMIAKLVVWGHNRIAALTKLEKCLSEFQVAGLPTNIGFLRKLARHPNFIAGDINTSFIDRFKSDLLPTSDAYIQSNTQDAATFAALAAVGICAMERHKIRNRSSWHTFSGFRLNYALKRILDFNWESGFDEESPCSIRSEVTYNKDGGFEVKVPSGKNSPFKIVVMEHNQELMKMEVDGVSMDVSLAFYLQDSAYNIHVWALGQHFSFSMPLEDFGNMELSEGSEKYKTHHLGASRIPGVVTSPMSGLVIKVPVEVGTVVQKGDTLMVLEAMKMEHAVKAPIAGLVHAIHVTVGQQVPDGGTLFEIKASSEVQPS